MSMINLSVDGEFRYIIQWFNEWSELQRDDFVPILMEYILNDKNDGVYMNGIEQSLTHSNLTDKPMSLFQCRIKLFRKWSPNWPNEFKHKLKEKIIEIDTKIGEKIIGEIKQYYEAHSNGNDPTERGNIATSDEIVATAAATIDHTTEEAIDVLLENSETSVDGTIEAVEQATQLQNENLPVTSLIVTQSVINNAAEVPLMI